MALKKEKLKKELFNLEQLTFGFAGAIKDEVMSRNLHLLIDGLIDDVTALAYRMEVLLDD